MATFSTAIEIDAPVEKVWETLADIGNIYQWNPGVKFSRTNNEISGLGGSRHCELPGKRFLEEDVVEWEERKALTMRVVGTNLPFERADIRFTLEGEGGHTQVTVSPHYEVKYGVLGKMMDAVILRPTYRMGMKGLLEGLKRFTESKSKI